VIRVLTTVGLESLVRAAPMLELAGSEADLAALAAAAERVRPDVVLIEGEYQPDESLPEAAVVLLAGEPAGPWLADAFRAGIRAVVPREAPVSEIIAAIEAAAAGLVALPAADLSALLPPSRIETALEGGESLTPRELDVFAMLAEGAGNKTIAWKLGISEHTVKFHVASIMSKLNATSRTEAVTIGIRKGLIML
jgi:two-component system, NarL family, response regulator YdfI